MRSNQSMLRGLSWRVAIAVVAFLLAVAALEAGVTVSNRPGLADADTISKVYYALGLFVLGGLDLGLPQAGPDWARGMLWIAYFACPAIATAAVVESVGHILQAQTQTTDDLQDHTIIAGAGKLAELYVESLHEANCADRDILLVDADPGAPFFADAEGKYGLQTVTGDITSKHLADRVKAREASLILLLTGNDVANLEAGLFIIDTFGVDPERVVVHLSDVPLMRDLQNSDIVPEGMTLFNSHQIAAQHLVTEKIAASFHQTDYTDEIVLAGFGRFGQSMLEMLDRTMPDEFNSVILLDREATVRHRVFEEQVELTGCHDIHTINGDMRDPENWQLIDGLIAERVEHPVIVLGSDDDAVNLQVALWLHRKWPKAALFVRTIGSTHLAEKIARERSFEIEDVHRRIKDYMCDAPAFRVRRRPRPSAWKTVTKSLRS